MKVGMVLDGESKLIDPTNRVGTSFKSLRCIQNRMPSSHDIYWGWGGLDCFVASGCMFVRQKLKIHQQEGLLDEYTLDPKGKAGNFP